MCRPKVSVPKQEAPAAQAVAAPSPDVNQQTDVDTTGENLKRKARGKAGLMITSNFSGGTGNGGTGLNI